MMKAEDINSIESESGMRWSAYPVTKNIFTTQTDLHLMNSLEFLITSLQQVPALLLR